MRLLLILAITSSFFISNTCGYNGGGYNYKYISRTDANKPSIDRKKSSVTISADKITEIEFNYDTGTYHYYDSGDSITVERPLHFMFKVKVGSKKIILDDDGKPYKESYVKKVALAAATGRALSREITLHTHSEDINIEGLTDGEFFFRKGQVTKITDKGFELWLGKEKTFITISNAPMLIKLQNALDIVNKDKSKLIKFDWNNSGISAVKEIDLFNMAKVEAPSVENKKDYVVHDGKRETKAIEKDTEISNDLLNKNGKEK